MYQMKIMLAIAWMVLLPLTATALDCQPAKSDSTIPAILDNPPIDRDVTLTGCYYATRHGILIFDCDRDENHGIGVNFDDSRYPQLHAQEFLAAAFRQSLAPARTRHLMRLKIRISGRAVRDGTSVPGGATFQATRIHCYEAADGTKVRANAKR